MTPSPQKAFSIKEIFSNGYTIFRNSLKISVIFLILISFVWTIASIYLNKLSLGIQTNQSSNQGFKAFQIFAYFTIFSSIISTIIFNSANYIASKSSSKNQPSLKEMILFTASALIPVAIACTIEVTLDTIGLILFIIPGVIIGIRLLFFRYIVLFEDKNFINAIKKSFAITKGHSWKILGFIIIYLLAIFIIPLIIKIIFNLIVLFIANIMGIEGINIVGHPALIAGDFIGIVATSIISFILTIGVHTQWKKLR